MTKFARLFRRIPKKNIYTIVGMVHVCVNFPNGTILTMIDLQKIQDFTGAKACYYEFTKDNEITSIGWTSLSDVQINTRQLVKLTN